MEHLVFCQTGLWFSILRFEGLIAFWLHLDRIVGGALYQNNKDYFDQRRHELGLMRSVLKGLSAPDKQKLRAHFQSKKRMDPESFQRILAGDQPSGAKRQRPIAPLPKVAQGGCTGCRREPSEYDDDDTEEDATTSPFFQAPAKKKRRRSQNRRHCPELSAQR